MKKFLIGQLACYGDCLYATTVAKQIKHDYPDCHITWAIAHNYRSVLTLNPHVNEIWEIPLINNDYYNEGWLRFESEARKRKKAKIYDELVFTQLAKQNWKNFDGTIRSSTLRGYKGPITVTIDPVIRLNADEINRVAEFATKYNLAAFKEVILFEYAPGSGQSFITNDLAFDLAKQITNLYKNVCFIFTGPKPQYQLNSQILDASGLTFRENAEITKYCTLLLGCSSGVTWLSTSDWSKKLNTVQLLNKEYVIFAGIKYDLEHWKLPTLNVIEITLNDREHIIDCLTTIIDKGFQPAKAKFDEIYRPSYHNFRHIINYLLVNNSKIGLIASVTFLYYKRNRHLTLSRLLYYCFSEVKKVRKVEFLSSTGDVIRKFFRKFFK